MDDSETIGAALQFAYERHAGQTDKIGQPYILHCIRVMIAAPPYLAYQAVAILHDVIEDTDATEAEVKAYFGDRIASAVIALTRLPGEDYNVYLDRVKEDKIALAVKIADLSDNMDEWRLSQIPSETRGRLKSKYESAIAYVNNM
jgi:(p)ppGpp synthase/HD superfamily hydrolase